MTSRLLVVVSLLAVVATAVPAAAQDDPELYPLVFPVVGENTYSDTFGAPRSGGRTHAGTDILADKMVPVVAAAAGTVGWIDNEQGGDCCAMALNHDDGWASWYIHLNNDTPGTDDGQGFGFAEGIDRGVHVEAGQLIGWVGDSGNAEETVSHLHFELHGPDGTALNPYPHLLAATAIDQPGAAPTASDAFSDIAGSVHSENIVRLAELGITGGCDAGRYCPDDEVTRAQMATFLARALQLEPLESDTFDDDNGSTHEPNIEALATAQVTLGCDTRAYCPNDSVTRAQMATFMVRAFDLAAAEGDAFDDDNGSTHEPNIEALATAQVTLGCDTRAYCPNDSVTRAQMATFLIRALDVAAPASRPGGRLVPASGVLVGAQTSGSLDEYEAALGRPMDIAHATFGPGDPVDTAGLAAHAAAGRIPMMTWTPGTVTDALAGELNATISEVASDLAALEGPVFLRYWPGLDAEPADGGDPISFWNTTRDLFEAAGAENIVWVWAPAVVDESTLPGAIDWLGTTGYGDACLGGATTDFAAAITDFLDASAAAGDLPVMVAEWGVGPSSEGASGQVAFIESIGPALAAHPAVAAIVAFDGVGACDYTLSGSETLSGALAGVVSNPAVLVDLEALLAAQ